MPIWYENKLEIYSLNTKELKEFVEKVKDPQQKTDLSYNKIIPCTDWYFWRVGNWGTKWDINAKIVDLCDHSVTYEFLMAWSGPFRIIDQLVEIYPNFIFILKYNSESGHRGIYVAHGENVLGGYVEYSDDDYDVNYDIYHGEYYDDDYDEQVSND